MKLNDALKELWREGFFENHRQAGEVKNSVKTNYGINPSNITVNLTRCSFLRKEPKGWIQKIRYGLHHSANSSKNSDSLNNAIRDARLLHACEGTFATGNYWDAIFAATRHLEVRVRAKSGAAAELVGADLMEKTFKPNEGLLIAEGCATPSEQDGLKQILKGIMMYHRNAKGHREETIDKESALRILGYVDYLLDIVETSTKLRQVPPVTRIEQRS